MERNFNRISNELKLSQESRGRIRSHLAFCQAQLEDISMKRKPLESRVPFIAAAVVTVLALTLTLTLTAVAVTRLFRNDIIVSSEDDIPEVSTMETDSNSDIPADYAIASPIGMPPAPLEEIIEDDRFKSDDWETGEQINGGIAPGYSLWDSAEVLSNDPSLRSRRVSRNDDSAEKIEYTAENPANLLDTLTGRVKLDLSWMGENYAYVPDANVAYVVTDKDGNYVSEYLNALYAKPDESAYVQVTVWNMAQTDDSSQSYIIDGSYETAYYYTTPDGYEFLIEMHNGMIWADCNTDHASISLYGAYLTSDEIEDILDHLSLSMKEQP